MLNKFAQERLSSSFWHDEWQAASGLALNATTTPRDAKEATPELAQYLAEALARALKQESPYVDERSGQDIDAEAHADRAIELCIRWKSRHPACYKNLLPATVAAAKHVIDREGTPEGKMKREAHYRKIFAELEKLS
ncbi:hypothetical protein [Variovorax sp. DT-64]|uniref:hypothetical protein n=1 Tax=Variovorax sp. DT-64 TaxID=3396160 RepID=UPI003F1CEAEC